MPQHNKYYDPDLAKEICLKIATSNKGVTALCKENKHYPSYETVYRWLFESKEFAEMYASAKRAQIEVIVDEILSISDDLSHDTIEDKYGNPKCNTEWIHRAKLKVDSRKWLAGKLAPRVYGDRLQNETTVTINNELKSVKELTEKYLDEYRKNIER